MHVDPFIVLGSAVVGFLVGMTGAGGGALMTPMLILLFGVKPSSAISSDLVAAVVMRPVGAGVHLRKGTVNRRLVGWMVLGSVPAAFLGAYLLHVLAHAKSAQTNIETVLGVALLIGAGAMVLRYYLDRRGGHGRTGAIHEIVPRPLPTIAIGLIGGIIVGMTSVGSGSLMIILLLFLYPTIGAKQLVGTDLTQAVPLTARRRARGAGLRPRRVRRDGLADPRRGPRRAGRLDVLLHRPRPLHPAGDHVRDLRLRPEVRRRGHHRPRLDPRAPPCSPRSWRGWPSSGRGRSRARSTTSKASTSRRTPRPPNSGKPAAFAGRGAGPMRLRCRARCARHGRPSERDAARSSRVSDRPKM